MWDQEGLGLSFRALMELLATVFLLMVVVLAGASVAFRLVPLPSTAPTVTGQPALCTSAADRAR